MPDIYGGPMDFKLKILSPHAVADHDIETYNHIYSEWKKTFKEVVESRGGKLDPDDFFRSDNIVAIMTSRGEIVALCTITLFDVRLASSQEHHYFQALDKNTPRKLLEMNIQKVLSMEYVNVLPTWRKTLKGTPWVEILTGAMPRIVDRSNIDAIIGTPRIDLKVLRTCQTLDAIELQQPIQKMDYPCAVVLFPKQSHRTFKNDLTEKYVQELLNSLEDTSEIQVPVATKIPA